MTIPTFLRRWFHRPAPVPAFLLDRVEAEGARIDRLERQIDACLAARKARRPALSAAAHKGVRTKRAKLHHEGA